MAQFAVLIYADDSTRAPGVQSEERAENDEHVGDLAGSGSMVLAYALTSRAKAVSVRRGDRINGVLNDTDQIVVGYYVLDADDLDAAVAIASQNPAARGGSGGVEVRPIDSGGIV
jgi:hypothetical protein